MRRTTQFSVTVPNEMAEMVKAKVEAGEYASESEVFREGLRVLQRRERALERWLREEVGPISDRMQADPTRGLTVSEATDALEQHIAKRKADRA
jgi:putative addiction module CopG family antidote